MSKSSSIEWTENTWNPVTGCTKVGAGCDNCYAERFAERWRGVKGHPYENGFDLQQRPERLKQPMSWKKPSMIFVNSMSDMFHKDIEHSFIDEVFDTMEETPRHTYQVLTKRSSLMMKYANNRYKDAEPFSHIWLGVSVENQKTKSRIDHLRKTNAKVRFLSLEPLLEDLGEVNLDGIHWVILGGESGPKARPMNIEWVTSIRDQCIKAKVPFFFKQWGGLRPKSGGRKLERKTWNEYPKLKRIVVA